jgi:hypothetical protein
MADYVTMAEGLRAARPATAPPEGGHVGYPLLEEGRVAVAEVISRSDLGLDGKLSRACQHPDNLWRLHGLHESLTRPGETAEAALIKQCLDPGAGTVRGAGKGLLLPPHGGRRRSDRRRGRAAMSLFRNRAISVVSQ